MEKFARLVMVSAMNNNKFYEMRENAGTDTFSVSYGRVGAAHVSTGTYSMAKWNSKYNEKVRKGYKDVTELVTEAIHATPEKKEKTWKEIADESVRKVIEFLRNCSAQHIRHNYTISVSAVTEDMVDAAQRSILNLGSISSVRAFNDELLELFQILPRAMGQVNDYLAGSTSDFGKIITREQNLLDIMKGQVIQNRVLNTSDPEESSEEGTEHKETILEAMGLEVKPVTEPQKKEILRHLGHNAAKYSQAWRVTNKESRKRYLAYLKEHPEAKTKQYWHGSRNENFWNILLTGLKLNPNAAITGKMFGKGIYFAPSPSKSMGYTSMAGSYWAGGSSDTAYMAVMDVACGKSFDVYSWDSRYPDITGKNLGRFSAGANYLYAHKDKGMLRNDELVVYDENQTTIRYLVEFKN